MLPARDAFRGSGSAFRTGPVAARRRAAAAGERLRVCRARPGRQGIRSVGPTHQVSGFGGLSWCGRVLTGR